MEETLTQQKKKKSKESYKRGTCFLSEGPPRGKKCNPSLPHPPPPPPRAVRRLTTIKGCLSASSSIPVIWFLFQWQSRNTGSRAGLEAEPPSPSPSLIPSTATLHREQTLTRPWGFTMVSTISSPSRPQAECSLGAVLKKRTICVHTSGYSPECSAPLWDGVCACVCVGVWIRILIDFETTFLMGMTN